MGIPSVTTNLSGFGSFIEKQIPDHDNYGLYIVDRKDKASAESIQQLADILFTYWWGNLGKTLGWKSWKNIGLKKKRM